MASSGDVVSLQDLCLLTAGNYLCPSNVWSFYRLLPYVNCKRLKQVVHLFICDNFMEVSRTEEFMSLEENEMQYLVDNEDIIASEAAVFEGLARWYKNSEDQRENAFKRLFDSLDVSIMGRDVLSKVIKKYQLSKVIPNLRKYKNVLPELMNLDVLICQENLSNIAVLGADKSGSTSFVDPVEICHWMPFASKIHRCKTQCMTEEISNKMSLRLGIPYRDEIFFLTFHYDGLKPIRNNRIDFNYQTISQCSSIPNISFFSTLIVKCGIYIYLFGQEARHEPSGGLQDTTTAARRYDTVKDEWKEIACMIHYHSRNDCAFYDNNRYLYVFGNHSEKYDTYTNTWIPIEHPWQGGEGEVVCVSGDISNDKIYLFVLTRVAGIIKYQLFVHDPKTNTWESIANQQFYCLTRSIFGKIFLIYHRRPLRCLSFRRPELRLLELDPTSYKERKLASIKQGLHFYIDYSHMVAISRGARRRITQHKPVD